MVESQDEFRREGHDYPQDFTGVHTDTGKGMNELKSSIEIIRNLRLAATQKEAMLGYTAASLLKI
jgi:hypothetical protein